MLLDPLEEDLYPPAALVELGDGERRQGEVVREEHEPAVGRRIVVADSAEFLRVVFGGIEPGQHDGLIALQPGGFLHWPGVETAEAEPLPRPGDEEGEAEMERVEPGEVEIGAVHDVEGARLRDDLVEDVDVVYQTVRNAYK